MTRQWPLSAIRVAAGCAIAEGKALVLCDDGVLVLSYHPLSRIAPNVEGDGFLLADEQTDPCDDFDCEGCARGECINCRHFDCRRCGFNLGDHSKE